ncbi:hypothetical protein AVEN_246707-1 [Araneus ventricosus]|uniref:Uncharacterized protein n=1 Tax=Araneus ventricosus TaxID=182803 RepID=A0A4Y2UDF3_ARAVE|nr:hypothetical protein AVEN_246707-1 [Araneus ventricosus]
MVMPKKGSQQGKVHSFRDIQRGIEEMKDVLLAVYAFTGCDTVSAIYRKGKIVPSQKFKPTRRFIRRFLDSMIQTQTQMRWLMLESIFSFPCLDLGTPTIWILYATIVICRRSQNSLCIPCSSCLHFLHFSGC